MGNIFSGLTKAFGSSTFWTGLVNATLDGVSQFVFGQPLSVWIPIVNTMGYAIKEAAAKFASAKK